MSGLRRNMMAASRGAAVDWESIARGLCGQDVAYSIPDTVEVDTTISSGFAGRGNLMSIDISTSKTTIANYCFRYNAQLEHVSIPDNITTINQQALANNPKLTSVVVNRTTPPTLGANVFNNSTLATIYVPDASVEAYKAASGWSSYADRIKPLSELGGGSE